MVVALPGWALGGMAGVIVGSVLPERVVSALPVALSALAVPAPEGDACRAA